MIEVINRETGQIETEKIYGEKALRFITGSRWYQKMALSFACRFPFCSILYGWFQSLPLTRWKIAGFVKQFELDMSQFEKQVNEYRSFNDFFTRKLQAGSRLIAQGDAVIIPADGRYMFYKNIDSSSGFVIKGKTFFLETFLKDSRLAKRYENGSLAIGRLAPSDYHRVHFPCDGLPSESRIINGPLYSVNPLANLAALAENKRSICELETEKYGKILMIEIGATNVGSIHQTYEPNRPVEKGMEKSYFSFGGSAIALVFEPGKAVFSSDLLAYSQKGREILCRMGQPMVS